MSLSPKILIVDDEEHIRKIMSIMLGKHGYTCRQAASGQEALVALAGESFDAVLTDLKMPGLDGLELLARIKEDHPDQLVIMVTAFATVDTAISAMKAGAYDYLPKPFKEDEIILTLEKALERARLIDENRLLKKQIKERFDLDRFLGQSPAMQKVFGLIAKVAETRATVLILGESGTGKELAARSIHQNSPRRDRPFVPVNCGAIPPNLMESEFFGHVKGAFTGADQASKGLIAESDGGTLFLDEVADLPLDMQVKLLRALQEEEVRRVGEVAASKIDLRVVAATNKDLKAEVEAGRFREDLYYRLNVVSLTMPPLRERPDDIPILANLFLKQAVDKNGLGRKKLSAEALGRLMAQKWAGNVRALRNAIEQGAIMSEGETITPGDFPFPAPGRPAAPAALPSPAEPSPVGDNEIHVHIPPALTDLKTAIKEVTETTERLIIERVLLAHGGNKTHAAQALGLSRRALITKAQGYHLD
ncbi:MAG: sigma-54 dependent transcriptional regulator [Candidatus Adiutrix sp.]|jgi:two-component system response regulator AtoC|nr:sigma-54 dependent transcriptional regulator [Candidatus Adiutrix sp.]